MDNFNDLFSKDGWTYLCPSSRMYNPAEVLKHPEYLRRMVDALNIHS
jgi:hypothetical protein